MSSRLIIKNLPHSITHDQLKGHLSQKGAPGRENITDVGLPGGGSRRIGFVGYKTAEEATKAREWFDRTFIGTTRISVEMVDDENAKRGMKRKRGEEASDAEWLKKRTVDSANEETIRNTARLFVRNIPYTCTSQDLHDYYSAYGVKQVHIPASNPGYAYVSFEKADDALEAWKKTDGKPFMGRVLSVLGAVDRHGASVEEKAPTTLKDKRAQDKKNSSIKGNGFDWAVLWMNPDAIATSLSSRFDIPKATLLSHSESENDINPSVKLALAETHIINETKTWLTDNGVNLAVFDSTNGRRERDKSVILVKGIPYGTDESALRTLFEPYISAPLKRLLLPPTGTFAIVQLGDEKDAQDAMKGVAYKRLGSGVIYLEWGWKGMFDAPPKSEKEKSSTKSGPSTQPTAASPAESEQAQTTTAGGATLYLKNLSFSTTSARLQSLFSNLEGFVSARVVTKPKSAESDTLQSMGYAFLQFNSPETAGKALKGIKAGASGSGTVVDGRVVEVALAGRGRDADEEEGSAAKTKKSGKGGTKMIIKNVPFEASKKDLRDLFGAHAPIKSLRLPKKSHSLKSTGRSRGFAFLAFSSSQDAQHVMDTMKHTHLLGRHLVLEWAEEDGVDGVSAEQKLEELRRKTGIGYSGGGNEVGGRKGGFEIGGGEGDGES